jgi:DNA adenine methylase
VTLRNLDKAPFPWFGGKSRASGAVWAALGDVEHYVEPFFGSGAVLLNRPHPCNRPYHSETVNDLDGLVVNAWRAMQWHPKETAAETLDIPCRTVDEWVDLAGIEEGEIP